MPAGYNTGEDMGQALKLLTDSGVGQILESARDQFSKIVEQSRIQSVIAWQKEAGQARQIILRDERLLQCDAESIKNAITNIAVTGLTLNPIKQHATILARWNYKKKSYDASLVVMYRGLMWLAGQAGVKDISVDVVYSADKFGITKTDEGDKFEHTIAVGVPRDGQFSRFFGAYVAARMPGSTIRKVEWVPSEQIYAARDKSESYLDKDGKVRANSAWVVFFDEMAKKVAIKVAQKRWEEAVLESDDWKRFQTAVALDNVNEGVIPGRASDIPGTAENLGEKQAEAELPAPKLTMDQLTEIEKLAAQLAPNTDAMPNNTSMYMAKVARTYRANVLTDVDQSKFSEIKDRLNDAIKTQKDKKAANPKGDGAKGQGNAGVNKDGAAKTGGSGKTGEGGKGGEGGTRIAGGAAPNKGAANQSGSGGAVGSGEPSGQREPGADDDKEYGGPENDGSQDPNQR